METTATPAQRNSAVVRLRIIEFCITLLILVLAKAYGRELADLSWPSFIVMAIPATVASYVGAHLAARRNDRRHDLS